MSGSSLTGERKKPLLMSPAGHWPELKAAVAAGADAVYFGLNHFSARAKVGFDLGDLEDVIQHLHQYAVKAYVTFNTLAFDHELDQACAVIAAIANAGADAIIVQDIGITQLVQEIAPQLEIHGSTQMSVTSAEGAELAGQFGCRRVALARELSLQDIRKIAEATQVELEVFVHGALCVSYSGQCFSSEAWGGRSANRGQCAQACRLSYDMIVDGLPKELGDARYLLSPGDLYAIEQIPELVEIGIHCLKIEGRYKGPEYVALTTRAYRDAIDRCFDESIVSMVNREQLDQIYSRGLGPHFISGVNHQTVVNGRSPRHRGLLLGAVTRIDNSSIIVHSNHDIRRGDGLVFDAADWRSPDETEEGGHVYGAELLKSGTWQLQFGRGDIDIQRIRIGDLVWRTADPVLNACAKKLTQQPPPTTSIHFKVECRVGNPLRITAESATGEQATFQSQQNLESAKSHSVSYQMVVQQLSRLGNTPFHLGSVNLVSDDNVFCPVSLLNEARRTLSAELIQARQTRTRNEAKAVAISERLKHQRPNPLPHPSSPELHFLVRNSEQLNAALDLRPSSITLDYLELYGLRQSVEKVQSQGVEVRVASPRILKPSEQKVVRFLLSLNCPILVRSGGLLYDLAERQKNDNALPDLDGDFSLNAANTIAFDTYLQLGLRRLTPTYDLNAQQISELGQRFLADQIEIVAFGHLPVFHTEHCVFCRFLSDGTDHTNCGHPCEKHTVEVQDKNGRRHPVVADVGCRNTIFGAEAQMDAAAINRWRDLSFKHFRIEFVHQNTRQVTTIGRTFKDFFDGNIDVRQLDNVIDSSAGRGISSGSLFVPANYKQLVQLS